MPSRLLLCGLGSSFFAAQLIAFSVRKPLRALGVAVHACPSQAIGVEVFPTAGDELVALTHRGASALTLQAMQKARQAGARVVQVSAQGVCASEHAHLLLPTVPIETVEPHTIAVTGAICAVTSALLGAQAIEEWERLAAMPDPDRHELQQRVGPGPTLLLGEWQGEWLAKEGALKLMEMAGLPVRAFGTEEFFHGPRLSYSPERDRIWYLAVPQDPRRDMVPAAQTIAVDDRTPLAWVCALVELQWRALAVAWNLCPEAHQF